MEFPAPTGTDYVKAQALVRAGARIRQLPASMIATEYPRSIHKYFRQQHRWMWNVWHYGRFYQVPGEANRVVANAGLGLIMLLLPWLSIIFGPVLLSMWGLLFVFAVLSRLRYLWFFGQVSGHASPPSAWLASPVYLILDFFTWAGVIPQLFRQARQW